MQKLRSARLTLMNNLLRKNKQNVTRSINTLLTTLDTLFNAIEAYEAAIEAMRGIDIRCQFTVCNDKDCYASVAIRQRNTILAKLKGDLGE